MSVDDSTEPFIMGLPLAWASSIRTTSGHCAQFINGEGIFIGITFPLYVFRRPFGLLLPELTPPQSLGPRR